MSFQEGSELAGLGEEENGTYFFEVNFNSTTREFEIITIWPYDNDIQLPGDKLVPKGGDKYILWNLCMPDEYYALAEEEFLTAVNKYNADHNLDISVYKAPTDHVWIEDNNVKLSIGRRVRLESEEYFPGSSYRDSRITKITRKVNLPSQMDIEISDALSRTSQQKMADSIADVRSFTQSIGNSISLPDIIKTGDRTKWTDNNLLSSLRILREFLSKTRDDRAKGKIASDLGFEIGNYLAGVSGGMFGIDADSGESFADVFKLYVRGKAYFETLTNIEANALAGKHYITPGGAIKCTNVEEVKDADGNITAYRCYFLSEQDGEKTETKIIAGDQAISEMFNAKTETTNRVSNHHYWRLVTSVNNDAYTDDAGNHYGYIDLSASDCESGSDIPQEGDVIDQLGNRTDASRRAAMIFSTVDPDSPSIKLLTGIGSGKTNAEHYSLVGKDIISQGYDPVKGHAYFKCYGDMYIGDPDGSSYLSYDQDAKELIAKLRLSLQSPIGDKTLGDLIEGYDASKYLREALPQDTEITGGVMLSTLLSLGYKDEAGLRQTLAGMNGSWVDSLGGKTIASWWGGPMVDLFDKNGIKQNLADGSYATSLVRMDGSGYFSKGAFSWDAIGNPTFGSGVKVILGDDSHVDLSESMASFLNFIGNLSKGFIPAKIENGVEVPLSWSQIDDATYIKALKTLVSDGDLQAFGYSATGGSTGSATTLGGLINVADAADTVSNLPMVLVREANATEWTLKNLSDIGINETALASYLTQNNYAKKSDIPSLTGYAKLTDIPSLTGYATEQWVKDQTYLTGHQSIHSLTIKRNGTVLGSYTPNSAPKTIDITDVASAATLSAHTSDSDIHITADERTLWTNTATSLADILKTDSDMVINKWHEVLNFLATYTEADTLANLLSNKVDKVQGMGLSHNDFTDALLTKLNGIEAGANKYLLPTASATVLGGVKIGKNITITNGVISTHDPYVHPTGGADTTIQAADGRVLSAITVNSLGHVTSVAYKSLKEADIPALSISKINNLQSSLNAKLDKSTFDELFEKKTGADGGTYIEAKFTLVSLGDIQAFGYGASSGGSGGGGSSISLLMNWGDPYDGNYALSAKLGDGLRTDIGTLNGSVSAINSNLSALGGRVTALENANYLSQLNVSVTGAGNAITALSLSADKRTINAVKGATFLTSHQAINHLVSLGRVSTANVTTVADKRMTLMFSSSSMASGKPIGDGFILNFDWDSALHWGAQLYLGHNQNGSMQWRPQGGAAWNAQSWRTILDTANTYISNGTITINGASITPLTSITKAMVEAVLTGNITSHEHTKYALSTALGNYVTLNTKQTITGEKTFASILTIAPTNSSGLQDGLVLHDSGSGAGEGLRIRWTSASYPDGITLAANTSSSTLTSSAPLIAPSFKKSGGTSSQFLKADGSIDSNSYALASALTDGSVTKIGTENVGSNVWPIYLNNGVPMACAYKFGNYSGAAAINNGTLNTNLNADMLDGKHDGDLTARKFSVTQLTNSDDLNNVSSGVYGWVNAKNPAHYYGDNSMCISISNSRNDKVQIAASGNSKSIACRIGFLVGNSTYENWTAWREFAFTDSNVASATKLADNTAVTAWGQTFFENGKPKSVRGFLEDVDYIKGTTSKGAYLYQSAIPTAVGNLGGAIGVGIASNNYGMFMWGTGNGNGHIQVGRNDGNQTAYNLILQEFGGNVGVNTLNPQAKLHVNGTLKTDGVVEIEDGVRFVYANNRGYCQLGSSTSKLGTISGWNGEKLSDLIINSATTQVGSTFKIGNITLTDKNGYLEIDSTVVATGDVQAFGASSTSGGSGSGGAAAFNILNSWPSAYNDTYANYAIGAKLGIELHQNKLDKTATAANAAKLNGIDPNCFVYGTHTTGTTDLDTAHADTIRKSGFYRVNNDPTCKLVIHSSHAAPTYAFQIGTQYSDASLYFRHLVNGTWNAWHTILDSQGTDLSISGNYLAWKKNGGSVANLTIPYATRSRYQNVIDVRDAVRLPNYFEGQTVTAWVNQTGMPSGNWYSGMTMQGWEKGTYATWQIAAIATTSLPDKNLYFRVGLGATWESWQKVLTDANYSGVLDNRYYTKTEVNDKNYIKVIDCFKTTEWSDIRITGSTPLTMRAFDVYGTEAGGPSTYGNVLEIAGRSSHWQPQLWFDSGSTGNIRHRNKDYSNNTWGDWYTLLDSRNYSSILDSRYYTESEADAKFAKLAAPNNLVHSGNEITMLPDGYANQVLWLNYRSVGSTNNSALTVYYMGNGNGGLAAVRASGFIKSGSSDSYLLLGGGGHKALSDLATASALSSGLAGKVSKAGDTMTGLLHITVNGQTLDLGSRNSSWAHFETTAPSGFHFNKNVAVAGEIYAGSSYNQKVWHQGNDGSGSGLDADLLDGKHAGSFLHFKGGLTSATQAVAGVGLYGWALASSANYGGFSGAYGDSLVFQGYSTWYNRLDFDTNGNISYWHAINPSSLAGSMTKVGTLAFIHSTVAAANKWATARSFSIADHSNSMRGTAVNVNGSADVVLKMPSAAEFTGLTVTGISATNATIANLYATSGEVRNYLRFRNAGTATSYTTLEAFANGNLRVNGYNGSSTSAIATFEAANAQLSLFKLYVGTTLSLADGAGVYGDISMIKAGAKIYIDKANDAWVKYDRAIGAFLFNKTIVSEGDVQAFGASATAGRNVTYLSSNGGTLNIPADATDVVISTIADGSTVTLNLTGDTSQLTIIRLYVIEHSPDSVDIKYGNRTVNVQNNEMKMLALVKGSNGTIYLAA